jgi:tetratricopeptide (TPR) repeat protein
MKRLVLSLAPLLLIVVGVLFWRMRDPEIPSAEVPVPTGETAERVLPDAEGNPEVWTISKREIALDDLPDQALPRPAPRDSEPGPNTDSARALDAQALESWKHGDVRGALDLFEAAIAADPDDWVPRSDYGRLLILIADYEEAWPQLERASELEPDSPRVWIDLISFYERNLLFERAGYARRRAEQLAGGQAIVQDETGLWRLENESIFP